MDFIHDQPDICGNFERLMTLKTMMQNFASMVIVDYEKALEAKSFIEFQKMYNLF